MGHSLCETPRNSFDGPTTLWKARGCGGADGDTRAEERVDVTHAVRFTPAHRCNHPIAARAEEVASVPVPPREKSHQDVLCTNAMAGMNEPLLCSCSGQYKAVPLLGTDNLFLPPSCKALGLTSIPRGKPAHQPSYGSTSVAVLPVSTQEVMNTSSPPPVNPQVLIYSSTIHRHSPGASGNAGIEAKGNFCIIYYGKNKHDLVSPGAVDFNEAVLLPSLLRDTQARELP